MTTESQAVRELRKAATCLYIAVEEPVAKDVAQKVESVLAELAETKTLLAHKNETANTFMNQVKKLQAELAACQRDLSEAGNQLSAERVQSANLCDKLAACQAERSDDKKYIEELCADLCKMEDALGFKHDCTDKDGAFVPTIGPWLERVRDLIAAEGELGDVKAERNAAQAACAEMRNEYQKLYNQSVSMHVMLRSFRHSMDSNKPFPSLEKLNVIIEDFRKVKLLQDLDESSGTGYVSAAELEPTKNIIAGAIVMAQRYLSEECSKDFIRELTAELARLEALKGATR